MISIFKFGFIFFVFAFLTAQISVADTGNAKPTLSTQKDGIITVKKKRLGNLVQKIYKRTENYLQDPNYIAKNISTLGTSDKQNLNETNNIDKYDLSSDEEQENKKYILNLKKITDSQDANNNFTIADNIDGVLDRSENTPQNLPIAVEKKGDALKEEKPKDKLEEKPEEKNFSIEPIAGVKKDNDLKEDKPKDKIDEKNIFIEHFTPIPKLGQIFSNKDGVKDELEQLDAETKRMQKIEKDIGNPQDTKLAPAKIAQQKNINNNIKPVINNNIVTSNKSKVKNDEENEPELIDEESEQTPQKKPNLTYTGKRIPSDIYKKQYDWQNKHLPKAVFEEQYKQLLFEAIYKGDIGVVKALIEKYQNTEISDKEGNTPLIYAIMSEQDRSVISMIAMDAQLNAQNNFGISALHMATFLHRIDYMEILLKKGASVDIKDNAGRTPLLIATENSMPEIMDLLLNFKADVNITNDNGDTALHAAARINCYDCSYLLITNGANIDAYNNNKATALMNAARSGSSKIVNLLVNYGADIKAVNDREQSAENLASGAAKKQILETLETKKLREQLGSQNELTEDKLKYKVEKKELSDKVTPFDILPSVDKLSDKNLPIDIKSSKATDKKINKKAATSDKELKKIPVPRFSEEEKKLLQEQSKF